MENKSTNQTTLPDRVPDTTNILEAVTDGVLITGAEANLTYLNRSGFLMLGLAQTGNANPSLDFLQQQLGEPVSNWFQVIRSWSTSPASLSRHETFSAQLSLSTERTLLLQMVPFLLQDQFTGTVSTFRDITREVEVDRLKSEFIATVSHEIRTPMTSILGYIDLLLMGAAGQVNEQQRHFLDIIQNNTRRLNLLVNALLDAAKYESGRVQPSLQALNLPELAQTAIETLQARAAKENKNLSIRLETSPSIPPVLADSGQMQQVLNILLANAFVYTPAGGEISLSLRQSGSQLQVDVRDNGIGIPPGEQKNIFTRFRRVENPITLSTPGSGLGLAIARELIEMHGGKIWVNSAGIPGQGSTFSFVLPCAPEPKSK